MSIERPEEPYALLDETSGEPNDDRPVGDTGDEPMFEMEDSSMEPEDYQPTGDEGRPEGSEGSEVIEDDAGPVGTEPVPDPDAGAASDPEPARPETSPDPDTGPASDPEPEAPEQ